MRDGFRWSPDGRSMAYWQFDPTGVERFMLINNTDSLYLDDHPVPYPKAGTTNSAVASASSTRPAGRRRG